MHPSLQSSQPTRSLCALKKHQRITKRKKDSVCPIPAMAACLVPIRSVSIRACAQKPDSNRKKGTSNWWTPLFGWSAEPDYIGTEVDPEEKKERRRSDSDFDPRPMRSRLAPGGFTDEKAKRLRLLTSETFHDAMYHSAIASRLASDFKPRSEE